MKTFKHFLEHLDNLLVDLINQQLLKGEVKADFYTPEGFHIVGRIREIYTIGSLVAFRVTNGYREILEPTFTQKQLNSLTLKKIDNVMTVIDV